MSEDVRSLSMSLGWQISEGPLKTANEEVDKLKQGTEDVGKKMSDTEKKANKSFSGVGSSVKGAFSTIAGIGAGIAGGFGLFEFGEKAIDAGENVYQLSQKLNLSAQSATQLNQILSLTDTSAQPFISTMERMDKSLETAGPKGNATTKALDAFGVKLTDTHGKLLPINDQLNVMVQGFQKAQKAGLEDEYATSLFGSKAQQMIPLLEDYSEAKDTASKIKGIGIDPKMAHDAEVNLQAMKMQFGQLGMVASNAVMPMIQGLLPQLTGGFTKLSGLISSHQGDIKTFSNSIINLGKGIGKDVLPVAKGLFSFIENHGKATEVILLGIGSAMTVFDGLSKISKVSKDFKEMGNTIKDVKTAIMGTTDSVGLASKAFDFLTGPVGLTILAIGALITVGFLLYKNWGTISNYIVGVWKTDVVPFFDGIGKWFSGIWDTVTGAFKAAWSGISNWFQGLWNDIVSIVKGGINLYIGYIDTILSGINGIGGIVGKALGINVSIPLIPKLASGTSNFQGGPAIINDGNSGELAIMPHGSQVIPADKTDKILGNRGGNHTFTANVNVNMNGSTDSRSGTNQLKSILEKLIPDLMEEYFYQLSNANPTTVER